MNFFFAVVAYVLMGFILAWGILQSLQGHMWLLGVGAVAYVLAVSKFGCLPPKDSH